MVRKVWVVAFSIMMSILVVEGFLRVSSLILNASNSQEISRFRELRVLCIGESTTALGGADSFPALLEKELLSLGVNATVINAGKAGADTYYFNRSKSDLWEKYKPHVVVTMLGINDFLVNRENFPVPTFIDKGASYFKLLKLIKLAILNYSYNQKKNHKKSRLPCLKNTNSFLEGNSSLSLKIKKYVRKKNLPKLYESLDSLSYSQLRSVLFTLWEKYESSDPHLSLFYVTALKRNFLRVKADNCLSMLAHTILSSSGETKKALILEDLLLEREISPIGFPPQELGNLLREGKEKQFEELFIKHIEIAVKQGSVRTLITYLESVEFKNHSHLVEDLLNTIKQKFPENFYIRETQIIDKKLNSPSTYLVNYLHHEKRSRMAYLKIVEFFLHKGSFLFATQYPLTSTEKLKRFLPTEEKRLFIVSNEKNFADALRGLTKQHFFWDSFAGSFGHFSREGSLLVAKRLAKQIESIKSLQKSE
ncbi:MAG: hypothetical protein NXH75_00230 [Halobacteriovoraceae bacterium]|nr:hypothetical protein [Halobacteriovoraceae bacterium]